MSDKRCGSCVWWGKGGRKGDEKQYADKTLRPCGAVARGYIVWGDEGEIFVDEESRYKDNPPPTSVPALVVDASGYFAALMSREDFGCILHREYETDR